MDLADHAQTYIPRLVLSPSTSQDNFFELSLTQQSGKGGVRTDSCLKEPLVLEFSVPRYRPLVSWETCPCVKTLRLGKFQQ